MPHLLNSSWRKESSESRKQSASARQIRARRLTFEPLETRCVLDAALNAPVLIAPVPDISSGANVATVRDLSSSFADQDAPASDALEYFITRNNDPAANEPLLQPLVNGVNRPRQLVPANDGTGRLFVVEQNGQIRVIHPTATADQQGPVISTVYATATHNAAMITWKTNESARGSVEYGTTPAFGSTVPWETTDVLDHRLRLTNLAANTTYHYRVISRDAAGNQTVSTNRTFLTEAAAPSGELLYNGIRLPTQWPPQQALSQEYSVPPYLVSPPNTIDIDVGRQLFVDDFLIESSTLVRTPHRPVFYEGNPILTPDAFPDLKNFAMPFSDGLWFDPADNLFKMWYMGSYGNMISYAYSTDGIQWTKPALVGAVIPGSNTVLQIGGARDSTTVWMDLQETDPNRKFKLFAYAAPARLDMWYSPNGINWTKATNSLFAASDRTSVFYNPFRNVWVNSLRHRGTLPATSERDQNYSRIRLYSESPDLVSWNPSNPINSFWTATDVYDPTYFPNGALPELYNLDAVAYESMMVGLFSLFAPGPGFETLPGPTIVDVGVGFSRDGYHWDRPTRSVAEESFLPVSNLPDTWNGFNTQSVGGGFLVVGDELWFYFSGRTKNKPEDGITSTGLAKLRRDGFYSLDAGNTEATLITRPITFSGNRLFVNVDNPQGELRVEVLDAAGNVLAPFSRANSVVSSVDKTLHEIRWTGVNDLSSVSNTPVRLRFSLQNGSLYSFWVSDSANGASEGYVAAGGPGFTGMRDTVGASGYTPANNASAIDQRVVTSPAFSSSAANLAASPLLDLTSQLAFGAEKGVLSLALHPDFSNSASANAGKLYVSYTTAPASSGEHDLVIAEYRISATNANLVDVTSRRELLRVNQPFATNVGGALAFGPDDGWLYIGLGDGGGVNDPQGHAQNLNSLLGKVLRVDVNGNNGPGGAYGIPASNPFVGQSGKRSEILAFGFRHPDAFSFAENSTGEDRLFVSDRGSSQREELNLVTAGGNYAWPYLEGTHLIQAGAPLNVVAPIAEYTHTAYGMSARGGLLYQGSKQGNLLEQYLWADHSGRLFALAEGTTGWNFQSTHPLFNGDPRGRLFYALTADAAGDVYLATADTIYKLRAQLPDWLQVNPRTGQLNALAADADLGVYSFRITARDQAGQSVSDDFNWTITATSQPPRITSNGGGATANVSVNENSTTVTTVVASDPDTSDSVALSLDSTQGADRALFSLNPLTGVLNFLVPPNHESPADADQNNQYQVVVAATDSAGHRTTQALTVTVVNVNEPPVLAKNLAATGAEGGTFPITSATLQVTDPDNTAAEIAFAVTTSPANGKLELSTNPGVVVTSFTQNDVNLGRLLYRHSGSETTSDRFDFTVMDGAGGSLATQQFQLAITPVNDLPVMVVNQPITVLEGTAQSLSATDLLISDVDNTAAQLMFTVTAAPSRGQLEFTTNPGAAISTFKQSDVDNQRVRYRHDGSETSSDAFTFSVTDGAGGTLANLKFNLAITAVNDQAPVITSVSTVTKLENGTSVLSLSATDADLPSQTLSYAITGGADALLFSIHATTGTLAFLNAPNFEQPADADRNNSYQLVVAANDGAGLSTSQNLTVNIANVNEPPVITSYGGGETASISVLENSPGAMGISANDPENASQVLSYRLIGGADQSRFNLGGFTGTLAFKTPPDFENPTDLDRNNVYEIRLRVSDGQGGVDEQTLLITVNNVIVNTTTVQINGSGNLEIKDSAAKNDDLLISRSGNDLVIQDRSQRVESEIAVSGIPSAVLNLNKKTVQIPVATIEATNKPLLISTGWGDDLVQLDTANSFSSDPLPSTGFQLNLGAGKDRLDFVNNPTTNNWVLGGMQAGYVQVGSLGTLEFTGLEIAQGGSGKDVFKLANASSANGFLLIDGDLGSTQDAIEIARDANMTLTNSLLDVKAQSASFVDQTYSLANILQATLTGGNSNNLLDASFFTGSVVLNGGEGNDVLFGGSGNDQLNGGNGHDWLSGNGGDDKLQGNNGRDILVGGLGSDRLNEASVPASGAGDDILIGGRTSYDTNKIAIDTLLIAWQSTASYLLRVTQIRNTGVGSSLYKLNALSVFDDNTLDTLFGGSETDWYFAKVLGTQGDAHDASANEQLTGL